MVFVQINCNCGCHLLMLLQFLREVSSVEVWKKIDVKTDCFLSCALKFFDVFSFKKTYLNDLVKSCRDLKTVLRSIGFSIPVCDERQFVMLNKQGVGWWV